MKLSEKILYCRKKAQMSQETLAERVGVSRQAVSKWETGEAAPEIGKLLLLAQTFGVTTDWLLSEDDPQPEPETFTKEPQPATPTHTWVDDVPGMLGTLMRRYGWLFGVRLAAGGGLMLAFGLLMSLVSNAFLNGMDNMSLGNGIGNMSLGGFGYDTMFAGELYGMSSGFDSINATSRSVFGLFSGFVILIGAVMLIAGVILAIQLRKLDRS